MNTTGRSIPAGVAITPLRVMTGQAGLIKLRRMLGLRRGPLVHEAVQERPCIGLALEVVASDSLEDHLEQKPRARASRELIVDGCR